MHFLPAQDAQDARPDTTLAGAPAAADSLQATTEVPTQEPTPFERVFLKDDKFMVVIGVVAIIWIGIMAFLFRTDRKIAALEAALDEREAFDDV
ncbi:MAG: CcmD family protein [Bacteroidota bacterium]